MSEIPRFRHVSLHRPHAGIVAVRWAMIPHTWPAEDLAFVIFRSNGPEGPWDMAGVAPDGAFAFTDVATLEPGIIRQYYYIVRVASKSGLGFRDSAITRLEHDADHIALELIRKKNTFLMVRSGVAAAVYPKKSWGAKCSRCYDHGRMLPTDDDCHECYGTGFVGGYLNPVLVPALFNPPRKTLMEVGYKHEAGQIYIELANWPLLEPRDLVVDRKMNIRYQIEQITPTSHRMAVVSQVAMLLRLDEADVRYALPAPPPDHDLEGRSWDLLNRGQPQPINQHPARPPAR